MEPMGSTDRVLAFVDEAAKFGAADLTSTQLRAELERVFADQARASLHASAHLTLSVEALPHSPAVLKTRGSLRAVGLQLHKLDAGLQRIAGVCEAMLVRIPPENST